jgi:hypothetical protein
MNFWRHIWQLGDQFIYSDYVFLATILVAYLATAMMKRRGGPFISRYSHRIMPQQHQKLYSKFRVSHESTLKISSQ